MAVVYGSVRSRRRRFRGDEVTTEIEQKRKRNRDWVRADRAKNPDKYRERERRRRNHPPVKAGKHLADKNWKGRRIFWSKARDVSEGLDAVTGEQLAALYHRQRGRCALTGRKLTRETLNLDHIIPFSRGGHRGIENLRYVCKEANEAKGGLMDAEFFKLCQDILLFTGGEPWK